MLIKLTGFFPLSALVAMTAGCGDIDPAEGRARLHLPPENYVADVTRGFAEYQAFCSTCHGPVGRGSRQGPPLVDKTYEPSHHPDMSFHLAVKNGVRQHHWNFGDMPARTNVNPEATADIAAYIRELQVRAGIN
ncbi:MAG: hypothetical protein DHS20C01_23290 [marine bacterium B5-7]|nr:MAG: hypothetical protein DHS20C01_23290 [marine bacterium B5-7]